MARRNRPLSKKGAAVLIILLAVVCIGGTELAASYFFAPEWFEKTTAPIRGAAQSAISFCKRTATQVSEQVSLTVAEISAYLDSLSAEPEPPPPQEVQLADGALVEEALVFADPSITELKSFDGQEILTGGVLEIAYFNQGEAPWADQSYGSDDIGRYGCGPVAMAMVINSMTDHETDPAQMAQWAVDNHHWARRSGSYLSIVGGAAQAYGLEATSIERTADAIQTALLSGNLVVALMGPGHFTKGGHFIVLHGITLSGSILVADPNSEERSLVEWEPQLIVDELSSSTHNGAPLWMISKPAQALP